MSSLSDMYASYRDALGFSRGKYEDVYTSRAENAAQFYDSFLKNLVCAFGPRFRSEASRRAIHRRIEQFFGTDKVDFVAIDGTCAKDQFQDFVVFSACAYGAKGQINLTDSPPSVQYQRWTIEKDVSMVAYMPVPFVEFADIVDARFERETFVSTEQENVDMARIDTRMMELAEVFLAYNVVTSSALESPKVVLLDRSMSSMFADLALKAEDVPMRTHVFDGRQLSQHDITVALSHPFNTSLNVPTQKRFRQYTSIVAEAHRMRSNTVNVSALSRRLGINLEEGARRLCRQDENVGAMASESRDSEGDTFLTFSVNPYESWEYVVRLFEHICRRLFVEKDQTALLYEAPDPDGVLRQRWMSPDDLRFLIGVGLRALVEKCWSRNVMLIGISKDSSSRYFSRNYISSMMALGRAPYDAIRNLEIGQLPWTDRILLELLPHVDHQLEAPWSTIEFDSAFMTVHAEMRTDGSMALGGGYADSVPQERLFSRSLAQFFLSRHRSEPLTGHVVFVDRLLHPNLDRQIVDVDPIEDRLLGRIEALFVADQSSDNPGQDISMYLLDILTRNLYPEVIGYPDPLHKADWGAKTVGRKLRDIIQSSTFSFRSNPIAKSLRDIREARHRR